MFAVYFIAQAADMKILGSLSRDDLKKLCGDNFPEWISFPVYEQVYFLFMLLFSSVVVRMLYHVPFLSLLIIML